MAAKMGKATRSRKAGGMKMRVPQKLGTRYSDAPAVKRVGGGVARGVAAPARSGATYPGLLKYRPTATPAKAKRKAVRKARMKSGAATMARPGAGTKVKIQPRRGGLAAAHGEVKPRRPKGRPKMKPRNRAKQSAAKQRVLKPSNALARRFARFL